MNNPLRFIDPNGLQCVWDDGSYHGADDSVTGNSDVCKANGGTYIDPDDAASLGLSYGGTSSPDTWLAGMTAVSATTTTTVPTQTPSAALQQALLDLTISISLKIIPTLSQGSDGTTSAPPNQTKQQCTDAAQQKYDAAIADMKSNFTEDAVVGIGLSVGFGVVGSCIVGGTATGGPGCPAGAAAALSPPLVLAEAGAGVGAAIGYNMYQAKKKKDVYNRQINTVCSTLP